MIDLGYGKALSNLFIFKESLVVPHVYWTTGNK